MHGHEFLEFEYAHGEFNRPGPTLTSVLTQTSGRIRYANNSNYRNDSLIRKESEWLDRWQYGRS